MSKVNTVLGPIDSSALGRTRMHEHLLIGWLGVELDPLINFNREEAIKMVTDMLLTMKKRGTTTVVDATPINLSRHVDFMMMAAEASGMNVIAATGLTDRAFLPFHFAQMDIDGLAAMMETEITKGAQNTSAKAGVIKVGTGEGNVIESEERLLRAAARVSRSTGVPIITHTHLGTLGIEQIDIFKSEGADLSRVVIGHTCCSSDIKYYLGIMERGAYAGFDRIGYEEFQRDEVRLVAIAGLISMGHTERLVLSQDAIMAAWDKPCLPASQEEKRLNFLDDEFIPRLQQGGIDPQSTERIMTDNPRRIFEGS
jgi:phosphotriesterase-related protein